MTTLKLAAAIALAALLAAGIIAVLPRCPASSPSITIGHSLAGCPEP